jgi:hemolysin activation/secretion protein
MRCSSQRRAQRVDCRISRSPRKSLQKIVITLVLALAAFGARAADAPTLVSTVISGSTVYSPPDLFPVYGDLLGQPITAAVARSLAERLAAKYEADGYTRPGIQIDDRLASAGVLVFEVVETRISSIEISGDPGPYEPELRALGTGVQDANLLRTEDLMFAVARMRDLAGLSLTAATTRDTSVAGSYRLNLNADFHRVSGTVRVSNRGTDEIGPGFLLGQTDFNGLLAGRATLGVLFGTTLDVDEYRGLGLNSSFRPTGRGLSIFGSYYGSRSDPRELVNRDDRYLRDSATAGVLLALDETSSRRLELTTALRAEDLAIDRGSTRLRDERLRLVELGMRWIGTPRRARPYVVSVELVQGIDGMGSGLEAADLVDDPRRTDIRALRVDFVRLVELDDRWNWRLNALGQYSPDILSYSERFKIGGDRLGRGFEIAEIAGDRGLGARAELQRRLPVLDGGFGEVGVYATYDVGAAWKNDRPGRESAATAGLGLMLNGQRTSGRLEFAKPLTHPDIEGREDLSVFLEFALRW